MQLVRTKHKTFAEFSTVVDGKVRVYLGTNGYVEGEDDAHKALNKLYVRDGFVGDLDLRDLDSLPRACYRGCKLPGGVSIYGRTIIEDSDLSYQGVNILEDVTFRRCDLRGCEVVSEDVSTATFEDCNLKGFSVSYKVLSPSVIHVSGAERLDGYSVFGYEDRNGHVRVRAGCRDKSLAEAVKYWSPDKGHRREIRSAVLYIGRMAQIRGWGAK